LLKKKKGTREKDFLVSRARGKSRSRGKIEKRAFFARALTNVERNSDLVKDHESERASVRKRIP